MISNEELVKIYEDRIQILLADIDHLKGKFQEACWEELISEKVPEEINYIENYMEQMVQEVDEENHLIKLSK